MLQLNEHFRERSFITTISSGNNLTLSGTQTVSDTIFINPQTLLASSATLLVSGAVTSTGTLIAVGGQNLVIKQLAGGVLRVTGTLDNKGSIDIASAGAAATFTIASGGTVSGTGVTTIEGRLANAGSLILAGSVGVHMFSGTPGPAGSLTLSGTGTNSGVIALRSGLGDTTSGLSSSFTLSGSLDSTGTISIDGAQDGFFSGSTGASLNDTGTLTTSGLIAVGGAQGGIGHAGGGLLTVSGSLANAGTVTVAGGGPDFYGPGAAGLINLTGRATNTGTILLQTGAGGTGGLLTDAGTLSNTGSIDIAAGARLTIASGGTLTGAGAISVEGSLDVQGGSTQARLDIAAGQTLFDTGTVSIKGHVVDSGAIDVGAGGNLVLASGGLLEGDGTIRLHNGGSVDLKAYTKVDIAFADPALLVIDPQIGYGGTLSGLSTGDEIEILGRTVLGAHVVNGQLRIQTSAGSLSFRAAPALNGLTFHIATGNSDLLVADPLRYCTGTRIRTPSGDVPIEHLRPGDTVLILSETGLEQAPIRWIGRRLITPRLGDALRLLPVRIRAGALADNLPARDLCVSPCHAVLLDDILVQAGALANGTSILRMDDAPAAFTYWHIELDTHALLLAEGMPAETFVDNAERIGFDNHAEHAALFRDGHPIPEMHRPRAQSARQVPRHLRARIAARAAALFPATSRNAPASNPRHGLQVRPDDHPPQPTTAFTSRYSNSPKAPYSRPLPDMR